MKKLKITLLLLSFLFLFIPVVGNPEEGASPLNDMDFPITTCSLE